MPFSKVLARSETQTVRIWTRVIDAVSYEDNRYTKHVYKTNVKYDIISYLHDIKKSQLFEINRVDNRIFVHFLFSRLFAENFPCIISYSFSFSLPLVSIVKQVYSTFSFQKQRRKLSSTFNSSDYWNLLET